jgi:hypothetical protein
MATGQEQRKIYMNNKNKKDPMHKLEVGNSYLHLCSLIVEIICFAFKLFLGSELPSKHALFKFYMV